MVASVREFQMPCTEIEWESAVRLEREQGLPWRWWVQLVGDCEHEHIIMREREMEGGRE